LSTLCFYKLWALNIFHYISCVKRQVLRRWRHRCHKSGKETPFRYQQITKLIEIGLLCQEKDPYKRPFISDIVREINELENMDRKISNAKESTVGQVSSCALHNFDCRHTSLVLPLFFRYHCFVSKSTRKQRPI
jgi:hypothetical protein